MSIASSACGNTTRRPCSAPSRSRNSKTKPAIVAFDENYDTLKAIQTARLSAPSCKTPINFGYESVKILASLVKGDDSVLKNHKNIDKNNSIFIMHRVIIREPGT